MSEVRIDEVTESVRITPETSTVRIIVSNPVVRVASVGVQGARGPAVAELCLSIAGPCPGGILMESYLASGSITLSQTDAIAAALTPATGTAILLLKLAGMTVGTIAFTPGRTVGVVTLTTTTLNRGDVLEFWGPNDPFGLADVRLTIPGTRNL